MTTQLFPFQYHFSLHPRVYIAPYTKTPIQTIDANIHKVEWSTIPWSHNFDDIRGSIDAPPQDRPNAKCNTKFKMMWDDNYLYILAIIHSDFEIHAAYKQRNSPIYQQDSDFEVFIDPLGSCHNYKELEINALNTVWNLMLDKPYWDGGVEHSGRVAHKGEENYFDVEEQKTAVQVVKGVLNNDDDHDAAEGTQDNVWVVEMALNHRDTWSHIMVDKRTNDERATTHIPKVGDRWRINFSRVEKKGNINWTWQQQRVWDAKLHKHVGKVDMHLPDAWGYVQFGPSPSSDSMIQEDFGEVPIQDLQNSKGGDPLWPLKLAVANIYYAQKEYKNDHGIYSNDLKALKAYIDSKVFDPFDTASMKLMRFSDNEYRFNICDSEGRCVSITHERLIQVELNMNGKLLEVE